MINTVDISIDKIMKTRLFLHSTVYNKNDIIDELVNTLKVNFSTDNVEYNSNTKLIAIKIKKTDMKKNSHIYEHNISLYYPLINHAFMNVFSKYTWWISGVLTTIGTSIGLTPEEAVDIILDEIRVGMLYNATTLTDNMIMISL